MTAAVAQFPEFLGFKRMRRDRMTASAKGVGAPSTGSTKLSQV